MTSIILPTHKCFDDALDELKRLVNENKNDAYKYFLLHGILKHPEGYLYAHAWLESAGEVIDFGIVGDGPYKGKRCRYTVDRGEYHRQRNVQEFIPYTWNEAVKWNALTSNYGPWLPRFRELTRDGKAKHEKP